jgi:hypothetical protein
MLLNFKKRLQIYKKKMDCPSYNPLFFMLIFHNAHNRIFVHEIPRQSQRILSFLFSCLNNFCLKFVKQNVFSLDYLGLSL